MKILDENFLEVCNGFDCGDADLNEFFKQDCVYYSRDLFGKTYCFVLSESPEEIVCAFTVSNDSIKSTLIGKSAKNRISRKIINVKRGIKSYPAVLVGRLAVAVKFKGNSYGDQLMDFIKAWFIDKQNKTGCRFIVVDAYNNKSALSYYSRNGFKFLFQNENEEKNTLFLHSVNRLRTRLMYFDLILLSR